MRALIENETHRRQALEFLSKLKLDGARKWVFECKQWRKVRSLSQNKTYWMWMQCIAAETGNKADAVHEEYKRMFLCTDEVRHSDGSVTKVPRSTTSLNTEEFSKYLEQVHEHAQDYFNCTLPWPDTIGWDSLVATYGGR